MKLFLIKSNEEILVTQRVLSFKKKIYLTVMNMHSKLLNNGSVYPPLSAGGRGGRLNLQQNFQKKGDGARQDLNF